MRLQWLAACAVVVGVAAASAQPPAGETPPTPPKTPPAGANTAKPTTAGETPPAPAPTPATGATSDLYPLKVGTKWTYKIGEATISVRVASVDGDGAKLETLVGEKALASEVIKVGPDSITRTKINNSKIEPPVVILKLKDGKAVKGDKWAVDSKVQDSQIKGEFVVKETAEKVKVPQGEFDAVLVEGASFEVAGNPTAVKYWLVPGKGVVKLFYSIQGNESVLELKEFTEPK